MKRISELGLSDLSVLEFQLAKIRSKWGTTVQQDDPKREYKLTVMNKLDFVRDLLETKSVNEYRME